MSDSITAWHSAIRAARSAGFKAGVEAAAKVAEHPNAGMVPPDGGSPTDEERIANIASAIRAISEPK